MWKGSARVRQKGPKIEAILARARGPLSREILLLAELEMNTQWKARHGPNIAPMLFLAQNRLDIVGKKWARLNISILGTPCASVLGALWAPIWGPYALPVLGESWARFWEHFRLHFGTTMRFRFGSILGLGGMMVKSIALNCKIWPSLLSNRLPARTVKFCNLVQCF